MNNQDEVPKKHTMQVLRQKLALCSSIGGLLTGGLALAVLLMAKEPPLSSLFLKFLGACTGVGAVLGAVQALHTYYSQREKLEGLGSAIGFSFIPMLIGGLCIGALAERPPADDRRIVLLVAVCTVAWWLLMLLAGIVQIRGARWGSTVQMLLIGIPLLVLLIACWFSVIARSPEPGSFWSYWKGTRLVCVTILLPACGLGLLMCLLDRGGMVLLAALAFALMCGAALGEWSLGLVGWPVVGAFAGGIVAMSGLWCALIRLGMKQARIR